MKGLQANLEYKTLFATSTYHLSYRVNSYTDTLMLMNTNKSNQACPILHLVIYYSDIKCSSKLTTWCRPKALGNFPAIRGTTPIIAFTQCMHTLEL